MVLKFLEWLINYISCLDIFSILLILLTVILTLVSYTTFPQYFSFSGSIAKRLSTLVLIAMSLSLIIAFAAPDLLVFYFGFETVLLPMLYFLLNWSEQFNRSRAGYMLVYYTLVGSLPFLLAIVFIHSEVSNPTIGLWSLPKPGQLLLWVPFFLPFAFKFPLFPFHSWLPIVHVEAPTPGSMLLAGLLLKLGGFGLIRYLLTIFYDVNFIFSPVIYTLALTGAYTAAFMALRQVDLKRVIAYSSIAHMSQGAVAIFSGHEYGISGGFLLLLSHGFVSAGLFAAIGIPYHKMHNRNIFHYGGMRKVMPKWTKYFQFLMFSNIAFPGTFSFVAELCMFVAVASFSSCLLMLMGFTILLNTLYSVSLLVRVTFLQPKGYNKYFSDILVVERVMLFVLSFLTFVWGVGPDFGNIPTITIVGSIVQSGSATSFLII